MFIRKSEYRRLRSELRHQAAVIEELARRLGVDPATVDPVGQVDATEREMLAQGKKILAVKHHRERTGSSLLDAKAAVDRAEGR